MIVLDTNVLSELMKQDRNPAVAAWMRTIKDRVAITSITVAEMAGGLAVLPAGKKKQLLHDGITKMVSIYAAKGMVLPFDLQAGWEYGSVLRRRKRAGRPIQTADAQIAAVCLVNKALLATRNTKDFELTGLEFVNPWGNSE